MTAPARRIRTLAALPTHLHVTPSLDAPAAAGSARTVAARPHARSWSHPPRTTTAASRGRFVATGRPEAGIPRGPRRSTAGAVHALPRPLSGEPGGDSVCQSDVELGVAGPHPRLDRDV